MEKKKIAEEVYFVQTTAKHLSQVYFGGNWTFVNVKDSIESVTLEQAKMSYYGTNTIYTLLFHINYYVEGIINALKGEPLLIKDKFSFDAPELQIEEEWNLFKKKILENGETLVGLIEKLQDSALKELFDLPQYGSTFRNIHGLIEHTHYHLGQINLIKKIVLQ